MISLLELELLFEGEGDRLSTHLEHLADLIVDTMVLQAASKSNRGLNTGKGGWEMCTHYQNPSSVAAFQSFSVSSSSPVLRSW